jgi:hypothetical protein
MKILNVEDYLTLLLTPSFQTRVQHSGTRDLEPSFQLSMEASPLFSPKKRNQDGFSNNFKFF